MNLIKKWKNTGYITSKKVLEDLKSLQNHRSVSFFEISKTTYLTSKELANEIKQYFDIDIHLASVRRILIDFGHRSKMKA